MVSTLLHRLTWDHREPNRASMRKCSLARCKHLWVHIGRFVVLARTLDELVGLGIAQAAALGGGCRCRAERDRSGRHAGGQGDKRHLVAWTYVRPPLRDHRACRRVVEVVEVVLVLGLGAANSAHKRVSRPTGGRHASASQLGKALATRPDLLEKRMTPGPLMAVGAVRCGASGHPVPRPPPPLSLPLSLQLSLQLPLTDLAQGCWMESFSRPA